MRLSVLLLICLFVLCCTGAMNRTCRRLRVSPGAAAAVGLLLLAASQFSVELLSVTLDIAAFAALLLAAAMAARAEGALVCVPVSMACGLLAWFLCAVFPSACEPGLLIALPAAFAARFLFPDARRALLVTQLSPLLYGAVVAVEDWYLFDYAFQNIGDAARFDAQICAAALLAALWYIPSPRFAGRGEAEKTT